MANAKSDYLEESIINHVLRNTAYTSPASVHVGLYSVAPGETGGGTELSGNAYARQAVTFGAPTQTGSPTVAQTSNSNEVLFPEATGAWPEAVAFGIFDAVSVGNLLYYGTLDTPRTAGLGDQIRFQVGTLTVSEG